MKRAIWPALILVIVVSVWLGFRAYAGNGDAKTVSVRNGTIIAAVTANGKVEPATEAKLTFKAQGRLDSVMVSVGDIVTKGQVLASLDTTSLDLSVREAQAGLDMNKLKLDQARSGARSEEIAIAQSNLDSAEAKLADIKAKPSKEDLKAAKAKMDKAAVIVKDAQSEYDKISWASSIEATAQARQLQLATLDYEAAKAEYESLAKGPTEQELKIAESNVASAKSQLAIKTKGAANEDLAILAKQVELAGIALDQSKNRLDESSLLAPFSGTILSVPVNQGELVGPQQVVITLGDVTTQKVKANIDEVDVGKIAVGQEVNITFDAFPGKAVVGKITKISPSAVIQQGATVYQTTVEFSADKIAIRPGMLANLTVSANKKDNVLMVPNRAIQSTGKKKSVDVVLNGNTTKREVEVGISNEKDTEIISGLEAGEEIAVR